MMISSKQILYFYLLLSVGFYLGFIKFFGRIIGFGGVQGDFEAAAAGNPINQASALLLLLLSLFLILKSSQISHRNFIKQGWIWIILIGFFMLSIFWSSTPFVSLRRVIAFSTIVLVCFVLSNAFTPRSLLNLIANVIVVAIIIGFLYQWLSGQSIAFGLNDRAAGLRGIYGDKNGAARVYAYGLVLFVGLGRFKRKTDIINIGVLILALFLSQSASALLLAFIGCGLILIFKVLRGENKKQNIIRLFLILLLLATAAIMASMLYEYILQILGRDPNLTNRVIIWELIWPFIESRPILGYGFGSFWASGDAVSFIERWGFVGNAHSGYMEAMLNGGIIGLTLLILLIIVFIKLALKNYTNSVQRNDYAELALSVCMVQAVINYIGFIILNHNSFDMFLFTIMFFIVAMQVKGNKTNQEEVI